MRAIIFQQYGASSVLLSKKISPPRLKSNQVRVNNLYSSVNPIDWKVRQGMLKPLSGWRPPAKCGSDFSGIISEVGSAVTNFKVGDRVFGFVNPIGGGAFAEQVCVSQHQLALIPETLTDQQAGVLPLAGLTAYDALTRLAKVKAGDRVMINGCSGGVGHFALQIAKILGAYVIGVCSGANSEFAISCGADEVVDYQLNPTLSDIEPVDVFFDVVSNRCFSTVRSILAARGRYVNTLPSIRSFLLDPLRNIISRQQSATVMVKSSGAALTVISQWAESNQLKPSIESVYPMSQMAVAQDTSQAGHVKGKLAICIGE